MKKYTLNDELYGCYKYFLDSTNFNQDSKGYGCCLDRTTNKKMASIAASGFMLASLVIGVSHNWLSLSEGKAKAYLTLKNFYENIPHFHGFFVHFADINTGLRYGKCEYSTIDTVLFLNGVLVVDAFFKDKQIHEYTEKLLDRVEWDLFVKDYEGKKVFCMAYNDIENGAYRHQNSNWIYQWHMYAEQLNMYFMASASGKLSSELAYELYCDFDRTVINYADFNYVYCPSGTLFTYQFAQAWFDFNDFVDDKGFSWFENSKNAIMANRQFCLNNHAIFKTFKEYCWGISSCDGPHGYQAYGMPPYGSGKDMKYMPLHCDGTVALYSLLCSIPFIPEIVEEAFDKLINTYPEVIGEYGLADSINHEEKLWIGNDYIGIDKGTTLLMLENYQSNLIWELYCNHPYIQKSIKILKFSKK